MKKLLIITSLIFISCNSHKTYCTEGLMQPDGYHTYFSELKNASNVIIPFNGELGEFYVTEISKCKNGFCVESHELGKLLFAGDSYILENGCHTK